MRLCRRNVIVRAMKRILLVVATLCVVACTHDDIVRVKDAQEPETLVIKYVGPGPVKKLTVHATGEIDGQAALYLMHDSQAVQNQILRKGKIDVRWSVDWSFDSAEIGYAPTSVTVGNVAFEYRFEVTK